MTQPIHPMLAKVAAALAVYVPEPIATQAARAAVQALMEPDANMLDKGMIAAENALDTDWDSGPDGESYNSHTSLRSDAPFSIYQAMLQPLVEGEGE